MTNLKHYKMRRVNKLNRTAIQVDAKKGNHLYHEYTNNFS